MTVYLWLPGLGCRSIFQRHPIPIAWWEDDERGMAKTIILLVKTGPDNTLLSHDSRLTSFIQGPYGRAIDFASYDRVLMIATGMGIAAQLPYLKELVMMKDRKRATRQLYVVWQLEEECEFDRQSNPDEAI
jgi:NAD(P)H-flavin reductase